MTSKWPNQPKSTKSNLSNQTYQAKYTKPNLQNQAYQTIPTKLILPNQTYQTKPKFPKEQKQSVKIKFMSQIGKSKR